MGGRQGGRRRWENRSVEERRRGDTYESMEKRGNVGREEKGG